MHWMGLFSVSLPFTLLHSLDATESFNENESQVNFHTSFIPLLFIYQVNVFLSLLQYNIAGYHFPFVCDHTFWMYVRKLIDHFLSISQHNLLLYTVKKIVAKTAIKIAKCAVKKMMMTMEKKNKSETFTCKYKLYRRQSHYHDSLQSSAPQVSLTLLKVFLAQKLHHIYSVCLCVLWVWAFFGKYELTNFGLLFKWNFIHFSLHLCVALNTTKFRAKRNTQRFKWMLEKGMRFTSNYHECSGWDKSVQLQTNTQNAHVWWIKKKVDAKSVSSKSRWLGKIILARWTRIIWFG